MAQIIYDIMNVWSLQNEFHLNSSGKRLIISSHGGWSEGDGKFNSSDYHPALQFYTSESCCVSGSLLTAIRGDISPTFGVVTMSKNYNCTYFEHDPGGAAIQAALVGNACDVVTIPPGVSAKLSEILRYFKHWNCEYESIQCLFCRYTGGQVVNTVAKKAQSHDVAKLSQQKAARLLAADVLASGGASGLTSTSTS